MNVGYSYIYDDFLSDRGFEREVAALETKLNTYDLAGRIGRLALFRSPKDLVEGMVKDGTKTLIIVGNDSTLDKVMWFLPDLGITVGYIPLVGPSAIGELFNIPVGVAACEVITSRLVETIDTGKIDDRYFLTEVSVSATLATLDVEGRYRISPTDGGSLFIRNMAAYVKEPILQNEKSTMGLEAIIAAQSSSRRGFPWKRRKNDETRIFFNRGTLFSKDPIEAKVDAHVVSGFRFEVESVKRNFRFITGRGRRLSGVDEPLQTAAKNDTFRSRRKIGMR
ncbi:MAG: hypothetical protein AAB386_04050 [Patescibacteria group bacterium]